MVPGTQRHYAGLTDNASGIPITYISIEQSYSITVSVAFDSPAAAKWRTTFLVH